MKHALTQSYLFLWLIKVLVRSATVTAIVAALYFLVSKMSPAAKKFWIEVFSDDGMASFSRVATGVLILACVVWDSFLVFHNAALPDFSGQALLIGTPYGLNVGGKAIAKVAAGPAGAVASAAAEANCPPVQK